MIVEIIIFLVVIVMYIKLLLDLKKNRISLRRFLFWIFIWFCLSLIVFIPNLIISVSNLIGIQRPQDFPIYVSIILLFYLIFRTGVNMEKIEQEITKIVKKIALDNKI